MKKNEKEPTISDSLKVIKKALEEDGEDISADKNVLILDKLIKEDGTIVNLDKNKKQNTNLTNKEISIMIDKKINEKFEKFFKNKEKNKI